TCTGYLAERQAGVLLGERAEGHPARVLNQLRHLGKVRLAGDRLDGDGIAVLPRLADKSVDSDMLAAVDVMLDISNGAPAAIASDRPPYKLCFLAERGDRLSSYGVVAAAPCEELRVNFLLDSDKTERTVIFITRDAAQTERFTTALPHYFAVRDGGRFRYFRGKTKI
ncbi:MAG: DUF5697 family protein, partial [Oscillospiraceae bacterium]|nr:DUF5697 family protein [Oscillospiraceae bacterium]